MTHGSDLPPRVRGRTHRRRRIAVRCIGLGLGVGAQLASADPAGGVIVGGSGSIGGTPGAQVITQQSSRLAIDWQSFSLAPGERTEFRQPAASAVALNRVIGGQASEIHGQIVANGQVYLVNPNGVLFGRTAQVDVGGLVASALDVSAQDFMAGRATFTAADGDAKVVNEGRITAAAGGSVALLGRQVVNAGRIEAPRGQVALAAGEQVSLRFEADSLVDVSVDRATLDALVENRGAIRADGGTVLLTARARDALLDTVINNEGVIEANSVGTAGGVIRLGGGDSGVVESSGTLRAAGDEAGEQGGTIELTGERIALTAGASIDASGEARGGRVSVGGSREGAGPLPNSKDVFVGAGTHIDASARTRGDGGEAVVYADDTARIHGRLAATGGRDGGAGGFVETSGKRALELTTTPDVTAALGAPGLWLIDPFNIDIVSTVNQCVGLAGCATGPNWTSNAVGATLGANLITAALNAGQNVTITTGSGGVGDGNITLLGNPVIAKSAGTADVTLTLIAHNDVGITAPISRTGGATVGRLNVVLTADSDNNGVGNVALRAAVTTGGGTLTASGQGITVLNNLSTAGSAGRNGGNIALTAAPGGTLNITGGTINAAGGTSTAAGTAGGNVTLAGGTVTARGITTSGGNAGGSNQPGGRAGTVRIDATGTLPAVTLNGDITARGGNGTGSGAGGSGGAVAIADPLVLGAAVTVNSAGGSGGVAGAGGNVALAAVSSSANARRGLTVNAGSGTLVTGALGGATPLGAVNLTATGGVSTGDITTSGRANEAGFAVTIAAGSTGAVNVGDITTRGTTTTGIGRAGGAVAINGNRVSTGRIDASGSNSVTSSVGGAGGAVTLSASGTDPRITLARDIVSNGGNGANNTGGASGAITVNGPVTLANDIAVTSRPGAGTAAGAGGAFNFGPGTAVDSDGTPRSLVLDGRGAMNLQGPIGQNAALANLTLTAAAPLALPATRLLGNLEVTTRGDLTDAGALRIGGTTRVDAGSGGVLFDHPGNDFVGAVSADADGAVTLQDSNGLLLGPSRAGGDFTAIANGDLRLAPGATIAGDGDVVLAARGGNFINDSGPGAIAAPAGRWLVYATSPAGNVANGLVPGNPRPNFYNRTIDSAPPATIEAGNHFVFAIQPTLNIDLDPAGKIFGDADPAAYTFSASGLLAGDALGDAFTGTPSRVAGENVGVYAIAAAATSAIGYAVSVNPAAFTITQRALTLTADPSSKIFGDADPALGFTITGGTLAALPEGALLGSLQRAPGDTVGNYAITQGTLGNANYAIDFVGADFAVLPRPLTLAANSLSRVYGDPDPALGFVVQSGSLVATPEGALSGALTRTPGEDVGAYAITQGTLGNPNYALSVVPGSLDITPRPLSLAALGATKIFGDADPVFGFAVTAGSLAALPGGGLNGALTRAPGQTVGTYAITQGTLGNPNYSIDFTPAALDVLPRALGVAAASTGKRYGDPDPLFGFVITAGSLAAIPEGALSGALARAPGEAVGSYALTRGTLDNPNYVLAFTPGSFDIVPRPLRVQARDAQRAVGADNPAFGVNFDGFAFGEDASVLSGTLRYDTLADQTAPAGRYAVTPAGLSAANYALIFIDGVLTVFDPSVPPITPDLPLGPPAQPAPPAVDNGDDGAIVAARQNRPGLPPIAELARLEIVDEGIRLPPDSTR